MKHTIPFRYTEKMNDIHFQLREKILRISMRNGLSFGIFAALIIILAAFDVYSDTRAILVMIAVGFVHVIRAIENRTL